MSNDIGQIGQMQQPLILKVLPFMDFENRIKF